MWKKAISDFYKDKKRASEHKLECFECGEEILKPKRGQEKYCQEHFEEKKKHDERIEKRRKKETVYIKEVEKKEDKKRWRFLLKRK